MSAAELAGVHCAAALPALPPLWGPSGLLSVTCLWEPLAVINSAANALPVSPHPTPCRVVLSPDGTCCPEHLSAVDPSHLRGRVCAQHLSFMVGGC